jgi:hypothetical protein
MSKFNVVKVTVQTGCDLHQDIVKSNLSKGKAQELRDKLEGQNEMGDFNPDSMVSYLIQPAA